MHLDDDFLTCIGGTIYVVDDAASFLIGGELLVVEECEIYNRAFAYKQVVQEVNQKNFGDFTAEKQFKAII